MNAYTVVGPPPSSTVWAHGLTAGPVVAETIAEGRRVVESFAAPDTHYVTWEGDTPTLVAYTPEQAAAKAARPNYPAQWSDTSFSWEDLRSFADLRSARWTELRGQRDRLIDGGFAWGGSRFDSDPASQQRIQGAVQLALLAAQAGQPFSVDWTLEDNSTRTLTGAELVAVGLALGTHVQTLFALGQAARAAVEAATTPAELDAVSLLPPD